MQLPGNIMGAILWLLAIASVFSCPLTENDWYFINWRFAIPIFLASAILLIMLLKECRGKYKSYSWALIGAVFSIATCVVTLVWAWLMSGLFGGFL